jgi:hypothetical protein
MLPVREREATPGDSNLTLKRQRLSPTIEGGEMVGAILAVGPRTLPDAGLVQVWVDAGSGSGHEILVSADDLALAEMDDG